MQSVNITILKQQIINYATPLLMANLSMVVFFMMSSIHFLMFYQILSDNTGIALFFSLNSLFVLLIIVSIWANNKNVRNELGVKDNVIKPVNMSIFIQKTINFATSVFIPILSTIIILIMFVIHFLHLHEALPVDEEVSVFFGLYVLLVFLVITYISLHAKKGEQ